MLALRVVACVISQAWGLKKLPPSPLARLMTALQKRSKVISFFSFIHEVAEPALLCLWRGQQMLAPYLHLYFDQRSCLAEKTVTRSKKRNTKLLLLMQMADGKLFLFVAWAVDISLHGSSKVRVVAPAPQTYRSAVAWQ